MSLLPSAIFRARVFSSRMRSWQILSPWPPMAPMTAPEVSSKLQKSRRWMHGLGPCACPSRQLPCFPGRYCVAKKQKPGSPSKSARVSCVRREWTPKAKASWKAAFVSTDLPKKTSPRAMVSCRSHERGTKNGRSQSEVRLTVSCTQTSISAHGSGMLYHGSRERIDLGRVADSALVSYAERKRRCSGHDAQSCCAWTTLNAGSRGRDGSGPRTSGCSQPTESTRRSSALPASRDSRGVTWYPILSWREGG